MEIITSQYTAEGLEARLNKFLEDRKETIKNIKTIISFQLQVILIMVFELVFIGVVKFAHIDFGLNAESLNFFVSLELAIAIGIYYYVEYIKMRIFKTKEQYHKAKENFQVCGKIAVRFYDIIDKKIALEAIEKDIESMENDVRKIAYERAVSFYEKKKNLPDIKWWAFNGDFHFDILDENISCLLRDADNVDI